jgi:hypothetical protein
MYHSFLITGWLLATVLAPLNICLAPAFEMKAVTVDLPTEGRRFPDGPGSDARRSGGMVLNQPGLSKTTWAAEANKMIKAYQVPVAQVMSVRSLTLPVAQRKQIWNALSDDEPGRYMRNQAVQRHASASIARGSALKITTA